MAGTFRTTAQQNSNYALHANNIHRFTKYINWLCYGNQGDFLNGIIRDTPQRDERQDFTSNKTVGIGKIVVKEMPSSSGTYDCNFLIYQVI